MKKKPIRILKKPTSSVWFLFYKFETEKPNHTQIKKNIAKLEKIESNWNRLVWTGFDFKKKPNRKWSPSNTDCSQTNSLSRIRLSHTHVFKRPQIYDLFKLTILTIFQSNLANDSTYLNCYPNFTISLFNLDIIVKTLALNIETC